MPDHPALIGVCMALAMIPSMTQAAGNINAPHNRGIITKGQTGGTNTIIQSHNSPAARMRVLFNSIDPNILGSVAKGHTKLIVRMEPFQINELKDLIIQAGSQSKVSIDGYGATFTDSEIDNGTLGPARAVAVQRQVMLTIQPSILQRPGD